jgi:hypothetical protein
VEGYARLRGIIGERRFVGRHAAASALGAAFVLSTILTSRIVNDLGIAFWRLGPAQHTAYALMARIPPDAPVTASERLVPHLATRHEIWTPPRGLTEAHHVLLRPVEASVVPSDRYEVIAQEQDWILWRLRP